MSNWLISGFSFVNEKILRQSKEKSVALVGVGNILYANLKYAFKSSLGFQLKL